MADPATTSLPADPVAGLIDIPMPPEVSLWPETWPLRIAIAVALVALVGAVAWFLHRRRVNRYRREALRELSRLERSDAGADQIAVNLALLVRRTALAAFPREQVAGLTGGEWLSFLDRSIGGSDFSQGAGRALEAAAYQRPDPAGLKDQSTLVALVRRWIRRHHA